MVWESQEKLRQSTAPKTTPKLLLHRGAVQYVYDLSVVKVPKVRNTTDPANGSRY